MFFLWRQNEAYSYALLHSHTISVSTTIVFDAYPYQEKIYAYAFAERTMYQFRALSYSLPS